MSGMKWREEAFVADTAIQVIDDTRVINAVEEAYGRFYVGTHQYIWIFLNVNAGGARVELRWFTSQTSTVVIGINKVDTRPPGNASGPFACMGSWVDVVVLTDVTPRTVTLRFWNVRSPTQEQTPDSFSLLLSLDGPLVGAGVTRTDNAIRTRWGWGYWSARFETCPSYRIKILAIDYLGGIQLLDYTSQVDVSPGRLFMLPPVPVRLLSFNNDAAGRNLYASVSMHPGPL